VEEAVLEAGLADAPAAQENDLDGLFLVKTHDRLKLIGELD